MNLTKAIILVKCAFVTLHFIKIHNKPYFYSIKNNMHEVIFCDANMYKE